MTIPMAVSFFCWVCLYGRQCEVHLNLTLGSFSSIRHFRVRFKDC